MGIGQTKAIQLVKVTNTQGTNGVWQQADTDKYNLWAEVTKDSGFRAYQNAQTKLGEGYSFKVRYNSSLDINASWRIVYEGNQYTVTSIERDREKSFYWIIRANAKHG